EFPRGNDIYLMITGPSHPFLSGAEIFHTPSLGDEEFEIPPISLDSDPSLAVSDVVDHFDDLADPSSSQNGSFSAQYGVQTLNIPVGMTHSLMEQGGESSVKMDLVYLIMDLDYSMGTRYSANSPVTIDVPMTDMTSDLIGHSQLTTIDQSELSFQLGLSSGGGTILPPAQSPEDRLSTTPSPTSSLHEDGVEDFRRQLHSQKTVVVEAGKKQKVPKKRKKEDPNKPQKPVSAYALFFCDTQAAIKGQNPNATFGEVSKIVASMWDSLGEKQKQVYKRKTEAAKKEYLKALTAYIDNQECQATVETVELDPAPPSQTPSPSPMATVDPASPAPASIEPPALFPTTVNSTLSSYVANQASSGVGGQPNITKLIITKQTLPSSITMSQEGMVTVIPATVVTSQGLQLGQTSTATIQPSQQAQIVTWSVSQAAAAAAASMQLPPPRLQPPPLQQMPQPPTQQQVTISQQLPPLQAIKQPPPQKQQLSPLQIKSVSLPTLKVQTTLVPPTVESSPEQPMNNSPEAHTVEATSPETICEMITDVSPSQIDVELVSGSPVALSPQLRCLSSGCENTSIVSKDWNNEYCSNECVVKHCRDVFLVWVASRNSNTVVFVK
uniref:TOX high mobility group box family member 4 n=1 Tax=Macaca nemestrina TaxID=9545 RepID=A0A2K6CTC7_MACNE